VSRSFEDIWSMDGGARALTALAVVLQGLTEAQQQLFQYVEDADLWRWKLSDSRQFHAGVLSQANFVT